MAKRPPSPKIPVDVDRKLFIKGRRISVRGTIRYFRKASNREVIHQALLHKGKCRLNVRMFIRRADGMAYPGWNGWSVMVDVTSVAQAEQFNQEVEKACKAIAERLGVNFNVNTETAYEHCKRRTRKVR